MSYAPPILNPSQTVERIREIIVGRQLDHLEGRISKLEGSRSVATDGEALSGRLLEAEAKIEALHDSLEKVKGAGNPLFGGTEVQREEVRQLAQRIHEIARQRAEETVIPAVEGLERKLGQWLSDWQISLRQRLEERDRVMEERLRSEMAELRAMIEDRFRETDEKAVQSVAMRFGKIAEAARMLADCADGLVERERDLA